MFKSRDKILQWLEKMGVKYYTIQSNGIVNVDDTVNISHCNLKTIPVQFGHIEGSFHCNNNQLTSLKGCPHTVKYTFNCSENKLLNLNYLPLKIGMNVYLGNLDSNSILNLEIINLGTDGKIIITQPKTQPMIDELTPFIIKDFVHIEHENLILYAFNKKQYTDMIKPLLEKKYLLLQNNNDNDDFAISRSKKIKI